jgi:hypothetical protein
MRFSESREYPIIWDTNLKSQSAIIIQNEWSVLYRIIEVVCVYNTEEIISQYALYMDVMEGF